MARTFQETLEKIQELLVKECHMTEGRWGTSEPFNISDTLVTYTGPVGGDTLFQSRHHMSREDQCLADSRAVAWLKPTIAAFIAYVWYAGKLPPLTAIQGALSGPFGCAAAVIDGVTGHTWEWWAKRLAE